MPDINETHVVDCLINPGWIIPMIPGGKVLSDCSVAIHEGRIAAILPEREARRRFHGAEEYQLPSCALMPGLVNTHGHGAMSLLRGLADDLPLHTWLNDHIWPTEGRWVSEEFVRDGTELAIAEMLLTGTTLFSDMYFFPDQVVAAARRAGIKAQVAFPILEFPTAWARDAEEYIHKGLALYDDLRNDAQISIAFGPHAPYTVADKTFQKIVSLAGELDAAIHIHLHETADEVETALAREGHRPLDKLLNFGALGPQTQCAHMTQISGSDLEALQRTGAHVLHCPHSNMKLASGFCPTQDLLNAGVNVALGTDGAASNNGLSLFSAMSLASLIAKGQTGDPSALDAPQSLAMATINGARALDREAETGSIEIGKAADLIAVDLSALHSQPLYNPLSQLVYTDCSRQVSHVWVNGRLLVAEGKLLTLDHDQLIDKARYWQRKISSDE